MEELLHIKKRLPLFCMDYDMLISDDAEELIVGASMIYDDLKITFNKSWEDTESSYSCTIAHSERGNVNMIFFNVGNSRTAEDFLPIIIQECSNVSWSMLESVGIELYSENKKIQGYVLKELITEAKDAVEQYLGIKYGQDAL